MPNERIAIIGGSIAGLATLIMLKQQGYDATVFERSKTNHLDRGAGIMLPTDLVNTLINQKFVTSDFSTFKVNSRHESSLNRATGEIIDFGTRKVSLSSANWLELYSNLVQMAPSECIKTGAKVENINELDNGVELAINGEAQTFDYVFFTDGYFSSGRQHLFPDLKPNFAGYILWRGVLARHTDKDLKTFNSSHEFAFHDKGHITVYAIPDPSKQKPLLINWALYETIDQNHPIYTEQYQSQHFTIPKGKLEPTLQTYLYDYAKSALPPYLRDIILETEQPFTQGVFDMLVPELKVKRCILIGDSGVLLRPHVAAGATKALQAVLHLQTHLNQSQNFSDAIAAWGEAEIENSRKLFDLSHALGDALVTDLPKTNELTPKRFEEIWEKVTKASDWYAIKK